MSPSEITRAAVDDYHSLLAAGDPLAEWEQLHEDLERRNLRFKERPICTVLRPVFMPRAQYEHLRLASEGFLQALALVYQTLMADSALRRRIGVTSEEEQLLVLDPGYPSPDGFTRLDGFLNAAGDLRFIEYNAESPGGLAFADALSEVFEQLPTFRRFASRWPVTRFQTRRTLLDTLLSHYRQWGGRQTPTIAIVDWHTGVGTSAEFALCQQSFEAAGIPTIITSPEALELRGGRLFDSQNGRVVDLIYKRVITGELLDRMGPDNILARAVATRAACMVNSFRGQLLFKKAIFALLSEWLAARRFPVGVAVILGRHLPWTRILAEGSVEVDGGQVDLLRFAVAERESLALKPNSGYGGRGVVLGWESAPDAWERALNLALQSEQPYVLQRRVEMAAQSFPLIKAGRLQIEPRLMDVDPYCHRGQRVEGAGVRLGSGGILNVTAGGGSAAPLWVLE
ncbi:MAG: hypothetical protein M5U01_35080 [Ardenticatenaceae bacterium]|nr:hypothetical protein [Ardenticatenaceae bacterium]HBY98851.1 hypothetical protein [Chloroflexota bacterium]